MAGLFSRILGRRADRRDAGGGFGIGLDLAYWGSAGIDRRPANAILAENLAAVAACVQVIAGTVSALPVSVYREQDGGRVALPGHPVSRLIRQPNVRQTWPEWLEMMLSDMLRYGNALSVVRSDARGAPVTLEPIPWPCIRPVLLEASGERDEPRMAFDVVASWGWFVAMPGMFRRYLDTEVLHLRDRSDDGFLGRSRITRSAEVFENATGLQQYSLQMWRNGAMPSGVLEHPKSMSDAARKRMKTEFEDYRSVDRARKTLLLEEGLQYKPLSVSPEDAEVLASRRFSVEEIARIYGVPPALIGDFSHMRIASSAVAASWFGQFTCLPIVRKIEAAFARSVFTDPAVQLDIDLSGLMRGDANTRWQNNVAAVSNGILSVNEIRLQEGYEPRPDGDVLRLIPGAKMTRPDGSTDAGNDEAAEPAGPLLP